MWYWLFRGLFLILLKSLFRFKVEGLEFLPRKTNFIVVANHSSFLDTLVIGAAIPKRTYWIATKTLYHIAWLRWFFKAINAVPSGNSSEIAVDLLMKNKNVGLFPEGQLSRNGQLGEFRRGAALLALRTGRPIVPCAIIGTFKALPRGARLPRIFVPITVRVGKPKFLLKEHGEIIDDIYLQEGIFKIKNTIQEMLYA